MNVACSDNVQQLPALSDDAVILAFGNSLTHGTGARKSESYPSVLEQLIQRKVINAGAPGELSSQGLERLPDALNKYKPDLLILCHAGNDILRRKDLKKAEDNIRKMIMMAQGKNIAVILLGVPEPGIFLNSADFYKRIAEEMNVVFIDNIITDVMSDAGLKSD
ncbi:MAG: GDSL-type esterase/lipase family protein, partial [Gammaproteobacteria bacterium]